MSGEERSPWRRPLAVALALEAVLTLAFMVFLIGELVPPLLVFGVAFGVAAFLVERQPARWPLWVALVLAVLLVVGNLPFLISDLSHPETFAGFAPTWLMLVLAAFVVVGAVLALRRADGGRRIATWASTIAAAAGVAVSGVAAISLTDDERQPGDVVVVATGAEFPEELHVPVGTVGFYLENQDPIRHTFVIEALDVHREMPGSTNRRVEAALSAGTYEYLCDVPGHSRMKGTLIVS